MSKLDHLQGSGAVGAVAVAIAITGLAAVVKSYNTFGNINSEIQQCTQQSVDLNSKLRTQFIVLMVVCGVCALVGFIGIVFLTKGAKPTERQHLMIMPLALLLFGIFGMLYALAVYFRNQSDNFLVVAYWLLFFASLVLGYFTIQKNIGKGDNK